MKDVIEFKSQDFYICAVIMASGMPLIRLENSNGRIFTFVFSDPQSQISQIINDHWNRKLNLPSRNLIESIHELRTRLHAGV